MNLIKYSPFISHAGKELKWKIDCDALTNEDFESIAKIVSDCFTFRRVIGIPHGGIKLAEALTKYCIEDSSTVLIVDDVLTTGLSMNEERKKVVCQGHETNVKGFVIFARDLLPSWIDALFETTK